jgi:hypothetical protein
MFDSDLAGFYHVPTKSLNLSVRRNMDRFPEDFMFPLTREEAGCLRFQSETSKGRGGRRYFPYVFAAQGVAMLSSVLKSKSAIQINIAIMRAFVKIRQVLATHKGVVRKLGARNFDHLGCPKSTDGAKDEEAISDRVQGRVKIISAAVPR